MCFNLLLVCSFNATAAWNVTNGQDADGVLGQPDFTSDAYSPNTASSMYESAGVTVDPATGKVFVAEDNHRVLRFDNAATKANGA